MKNLVLSIPHAVDTVSVRVQKGTERFIETRVGKLFLSLVLIGPFTFIPTVWEAWTAANIDSMRTITWPLMIVVNLASLLNVVHNGDWKMRFVLFLWVIAMSLVFIATLIR